MGQVLHKMSRLKIYRKWTAMLSRCRNPNDPNYVNYGKRGITVCKEWYRFENFFFDMGDLPFSNAQIDRIDNEKGYSKENCRWISAKGNSRNKRTTKLHKTHLGNIVQAELIEKIGWTKNQFTWFYKRYGISWILEKFKDSTIPCRTNISIERLDIVGKCFHDWTVLSFENYTKKTGHLYLCKCICGEVKLIPRNNLLKLKTRRCRSCAAKIQWLSKRGSI